MYWRGKPSFWCKEGPCECLHLNGYLATHTQIVTSNSKQPCQFAYVIGKKKDGDGTTTLAYNVLYNVNLRQKNLS